jgi:hypothetical protein
MRKVPVIELHKSGFDMKKLSIVGQGYHTEGSVVGYYNTGNRMKHWGKYGTFWGGLWGLLIGAAFFLVPGFGPVTHLCEIHASPLGRGYGRPRLVQFLARKQMLAAND